VGVAARSAPAREGDGVTKLAAALLFLALDYYVYYHLATQEILPARSSLEAFPTELGEWHCRHREALEPQVVTNLGVTDYLVCTFERKPNTAFVGLYVGYHGSQVRKEGGGSNNNMIHPPAHCLPGSGWDIIDSRLVSLDLPGLPGAPARVNRLIVAKGELRQIVVYWYQERGRVIARDWEKIFDLFWDRAARSRTDGALVRFSATIGLKESPDEVQTRVFDLAREVVPKLPDYVPN
jgi:EpsI family protein